MKKTKEERKEERKEEDIIIIKRSLSPVAGFLLHMLWCWWLWWGFGFLQIWTSSIAYILDF
jgi:hypothetical protein